MVGDRVMGGIMRGIMGGEMGMGEGRDGERIDYRICLVSI